MFKTVISRLTRSVAAACALLAAPVAAWAQGETGPVARFTTSAGTVTFTLFDSKPITTTNFINIITAGNYNNVILNRAPRLGNGQPFVIQGGGFFAPAASNGVPPNTPAVAQIMGEPGVSNVKGTIAMALSSGPNSGTKEFFFNQNDLNVFLDDEDSGGPFTVFGRVRGPADQMVLDTISGLSTFTICSTIQPPQPCAGNEDLSPFGRVPLIGYPGTGPIAPTNYTIIQVAEVSPQIRTQPVAQTVFAGQTAQFSVGAAGTGTLAFQWRRNGVNLSNGNGISGANTATLMIAGAQTANAGNYDCLVSNNVTGELGIAAAASAAVALSVNNAPGINQHPSNQTVNQGQTAMFAVDASGAGLSFQWRRGGVNLSNGGNIAGATSNQLTVSNAQAGDVGSYDCLVSNGAGTTGSNAATLTVVLTPGITTQPSNSTVVAGQTAMFTVGASGTSPGFQWRRNGVNLSNGGKFSGVNTATLTITNAQAAEAGNYDCIASNAAGSAMSNMATLTITNAPVITQQPTSNGVAIGGNTTLTVAAAGTAPLNYQWRRGGMNLSNGGNISGATGPSLTISNVQAGDVASYDCVVSNASGTATSNAVMLQVVSAPTIATQPTDQSVVLGSTATFTVAANGNLLSFNWRKNGLMLNNGGSISGAQSATLMVSNVTMADFGAYDVVITNGAGMVSSIVVNLIIIEAPSITSHPAGITRDPGQTAIFSVGAAGGNPLAFQWRKGGVNISNGGRFSGATSSQLVITGVVAGDAADYSCVVSNPAGSASSNNATLTVNSPPVFTQHPAGQSANAGGNASFTVAATGPGTITYQWRRNGMNLSNGTGIAGATAATLNLTGVQAASAGDYDCVATNSVGSTTSNAAALTVNTAPVITMNPAAQTVAAGSNASFTVSASGAGTLTYRWRRNGINLNNGGAISGATSATLTITGAQSANAGNYSCVVTGSVSPAATSAAAALVVVNPPVVTSHPANRTVDPLATVNFNVAATGSALSYQWRRGGVNLMNGPGVSGATGPGLTLSNVLPGAMGASGMYDCVVTNIAGMATSNAATLTVRDIPYFTTHPTSVPAGVAGQGAGFTVVGNGSGPPTYQWFKGAAPGGSPLADGGSISGATTQMLTINPLAGDDAGTYYCVATNANGTATSNVATLVVIVPPSITVQPTDQFVANGLNATFTLTAAGTAPLTYQWFGDGDPVADSERISGAATPTLTINDVGPGDVSVFTCVVSNSVGTAMSDPVALLVGDPPVVNATNYGETLIAIAGENASLSISDFAGSPTVAFQWRRNGVNLVNGANPAPPTGGAPGRPGGVAGTQYAGVATPTLTMTGAHADIAGTYDCVLTNDYGSGTAPQVVISFVVPPQIVQHPEGEFVVLGATAAFSVVAGGTEPLTYQWKTGGGTPVVDDGRISGAQTATLTIADVMAGDGGDYFCTVSQEASGRSVDSDEAGLNIGEAPVITVNPPITADVAIGGSTTLSVTATGTETLNYQWFKDGSPVAEDCPEMGGPPRFCGTQTPTLTISVAQMGDSGLYQCVVTNQYGGVASNATDLAVVFPPQITVQPSTFNFGYQGGSVSVSVQAVGGRLSYQWQNSINNADYVDLVDGPAGTIGTIGTAAVVSGATTPTLTFSNIDFAFQFAQFNRCVVTNAAGQVVSNFGIALITGAPQITVQPSNSNAVNGSVAQFTTEFTTNGPGPLTYQWFRNDVALTPDGHLTGTSGTADQTGPNSYSATLTIFGVQDADVGDYYCRVSDPSPNSTNTNQASLRQGRPIVITQNHVNGGLYTTGGFGTIHIFTGSGPFTVTWRKDGVPIVPDSRITIDDVFSLGDGRLATQLNLNPSIPGDTGFYDVVVCNPPAGMDNCVTSMGGTITFGDRPQEDGISGDRSIALGGTLRLELDLDAGTPPFTYQWYKGTVAPENALVNDGRISGADTDTLVITGMTADDAGLYICVVSSPFGSDSDDVSVTVGNPPVITFETAGPVNVANGGSFQLFVTATGDETLVYQWRREGVALMNSADVSGAQSDELEITNAFFATGGNYTCEVANDFGNAMTGQIVVNVEGVAPNITMQPQAITRPLGGNAAFSVMATGDPAPTYQWATFRMGTFTLLSDGDTADGTTIAGANTPMLQLTGLHLSDFVDPYFCFVTNAEGEALSNMVALTQLSAPTYLLHPQDQTVNQGDSVTFTARIDGPVLGGNPFTFTWFSGLTGSGATALVAGGDVSFGIDPMDPFTIFLTISNVQPESPLRYYFVNVANGAGNATGNFATLTVTPSVPPCRVEYNGDGSLNPDDIGDFVTDYFSEPPIPGPGGYAGPCPENDPPYDAGYKVNFTPDGSVQCGPPFPDNIGDWITAYFEGCPD